MWVVANVPASGIRLKVKVMDEDTRNKDDGLGVAYVESGPLEIGMKKEYKQGLSLRKAGDKGVLVTRMLTAGCSMGRWKHLGGEVEVALEVLPNDEGAEKANRAFTLGPSKVSSLFLVFLYIF